MINFPIKEPDLLKKLRKILGPEAKIGQDSCGHLFVKTDLTWGDDGIIPMNDPKGK